MLLEFLKQHSEASILILMAFIVSLADIYQTKISRTIRMSGICRNRQP